MRILKSSLIKRTSIKPFILFFLKKITFSRQFFSPFSITLTNHSYFNSYSFKSSLKNNKSIKNTIITNTSPKTTLITNKNRLKNKQGIKTRLYKWKNCTFLSILFNFSINFCMSSLMAPLMSICIEFLRLNFRVF